MTPPSRLKQNVVTVLMYLFFILLAAMVLMPSGEADPPRPTPAAEWQGMEPGCWATPFGCQDGQ